MPNNHHQPWRVLDTKEVFAARPWLKLSVEKVEVADGRVVDDFYQLELPDFTVVFAETPEGRVLVIRQYKHGPRRISLTLPGGQLEPEENPLDAARRELLEETGYKAARWTSLGSYMVNGNLGCGRGYFFKASGADRFREPDSGDLENMEILLMDRPELAAAPRQVASPPALTPPSAPLTNSRRSSRTPPSPSSAAVGRGWWSTAAPSRLSRPPTPTPPSSAARFP